MCVVCRRRSGGRSGIMTSPEVRELLAFLRAVVEPNGSTDLYALATAEPYRLGGEDLTAILELAHRRHRSLWSVLVELIEQPGLLRLAAATRAAIGRVVTDLRAAMAEAHQRASHGGAVRPSAANGAVSGAGGCRRARRRRSIAPGRAIVRAAGASRARSSRIRGSRWWYRTCRRCWRQARIRWRPTPTLTSRSCASSPCTRPRASSSRSCSCWGMAEGRFPARGRRDRLALPDVAAVAAAATRRRRGPRSDASATWP